MDYAFCPATRLNFYYVYYLTAWEGVRDGYDRQENTRNDETAKRKGSTIDA